MTTAEAIKEPFSPPANVQGSPWHSPVPYLFGGLAAMLALISFALLILACSYWQLSGHFDNDDDERDLEAGEDKCAGDASKASSPVFEEKILVIMAGDVNPTFLATLSSSVDNSKGKRENEEGDKKGQIVHDEKPKEEPVLHQTTEMQ